MYMEVQVSREAWILGATPRINSSRQGAKKFKKHHRGHRAHREKIFPAKQNTFTVIRVAAVIPVPAVHLYIDNND